MLPFEIQGKEGLKEEEESHKVKSFVRSSRIRTKQWTLDSVAGRHWCPRPDHQGSGGCRRRSRVGRAVGGCGEEMYTSLPETWLGKEMGGGVGRKRHRRGLFLFVAIYLLYIEI